MKILIVCVVLFSVFGTAATAAIVNSNLTVSSFSVGIFPTGAPGFIGDVPGRMDVNVNGTIPSELNCPNSRPYELIATLPSADPDRLMFHLLISAATAGKKVTLTITDDPKLAVAPGICSLRFVFINP
jgi:hypothetical protein